MVDEAGLRAGPNPLILVWSGRGVAPVLAETLVAPCHPPSPYPHVRLLLILSFNQTYPQSPLRQLDASSVEHRKFSGPSSILPQVCHHPLSPAQSRILFQQKVPVRNVPLSSRISLVTPLPKRQRRRSCCTTTHHPQRNSTSARTHTPSTWRKPKSIWTA